MPCGHAAAEASGRMCRHLVEQGEDAYDHVRLLTGRGLTYDTCCEDCDRDLQTGKRIDLLPTCEGCAANLAEEYTFSLLGWRGEPEVLNRPEPVDDTRRTTTLPVQLGPVADLVPLRDGDRSTWLVLCEDGRIARFDAGTGAYEFVAAASVSPGDDKPYFKDKPPRRKLHVAANGAYAAVVVDYGTRGEVLDLSTGRRTAELTGGDYHQGTVPFSFGFFARDGRTLAVHRTQWNRLAVSDPATGLIVNPGRESSYFHGRLHVSPSHHWLADDAWVWTPVGSPIVLDLGQWPQGDSADDQQEFPHLRLTDRAYLWDSPMCWIGDDLFAISGIGHDAEALLAGARVFDARTGAEVMAFAGPRGAFFSDGRRLYAANEDGTEIWDPYTGERTGTVPAFAATHHHPTANELVALDSDRTALVRWSLRAP